MFVIATLLLYVQLKTSLASELVTHQLELSLDQHPLPLSLQWLLDSYLEEARVEMGGW